MQDFAPTDYHTYGVDWRGDKLTFYADGAPIRQASASCLVGQEMTVIFSHEPNAAFDGNNAGENSLSIPLAADSLFEINYFRLEARPATNARQPGASSATNPARTLFRASALRARQAAHFGRVWGGGSRRTYALGPVCYPLGTGPRRPRRARHSGGPTPSTTCARPSRSTASAR